MSAKCLQLSKRRMQHTIIITGLMSSWTPCFDIICAFQKVSPDFYFTAQLGIKFEVMWQAWGRVDFPSDLQEGAQCQNLPKWILIVCSSLYELVQLRDVGCLLRISLPLLYQRVEHTFISLSLPYPLLFSHLLFSKSLHIVRLLFLCPFPQALPSASLAAWCYATAQ